MSKPNISARIIADSINPANSRLTSWILRYPRWLHSELMTHRVFSRSAASSRAIPFKKMLDAVMKEPALPEYWAKDHKGMSPSDCFTPEEIETKHEQGDGTVVWSGIKSDYRFILRQVCGMAAQMNQQGLAKSLANRLIEPGAHIEVLVTAHDFNNFFSLRAHPDAMPEFQVLAYRMLDQYLKSVPKALSWGDWHIPSFFTPGDDRNKIDNSNLELLPDGERLKIATARCARLSYLTHEGNYDNQADIDLYNRILSSRHMGPFEHCAQAVIPDYGYAISNFDNPKGGYDEDLQVFAINEGLCGWLQYRKLIEGENRTNADLQAIMATKPAWITL